jgi:hypothetical protein
VSAGDDSHVAAELQELSSEPPAAQAGTRTFISYSRREYYFAECPALALHTRGASPWIDTFDLRPGREWAHDIDAGLEDCGNLVLVGSRASLASANVREEWMHVHAAGKPVVIALFESVDLPTELGAAPTVDFRTNFSAGVTRLAEILRAPTSTISSSDRARRPARSMSGFLPRWSVDVWLVVLAALGIAAVALAVGIMFASDLLASGELYGEAREVILPSIVALFTWLWVLATSAYLPWAVIHRRFKFNDLRIMLCFGWLFLWICGSSISTVKLNLLHLSLPDPVAWAADVPSHGEVFDRLMTRQDPAHLAVASGGGSRMHSSWTWQPENLPTPNWQICMGSVSRVWPNSLSVIVPRFHDMNEMCGQLPTRSMVEVSNVPVLRHEIVGWSPSDWARRLETGGPDHTSTDEPAPTVPTAPVSAPTPDPPHRLSENVWSGRPQ